MKTNLLLPILIGFAIAAASVTGQNLMKPASPEKAAEIAAAPAMALTVIVRDQRGIGTAWPIDSSGDYLTVNHVANKRSGDTPTLIFADGTKHAAQIIYEAPETAISVLHVEGITNGKFLQTGNSDQIALGDIAFKIGDGRNLGVSVTKGIFSLKSRNYLFMKYIMSDAPANPGDSGSPLIGSDGKVLGMVDTIFSQIEVHQSTGVTLVVPINDIRQKLQKNAPADLRARLQLG